MTRADLESAPDVRSNEELAAATGAGLRWMTYTRVVLELSMLASLVVLARLIPPAAFGVFAVVVLAQEIALSVPAEGIGSAIVQRRSIQRAHLQAGLAFSLVLGTAMAAATIVIALLVVDPLLGSETADLLIVASPCFILGAISALPTAILRRRLDFARLSQVDLVGTLVRLGATLVLAILGLDASALVLGYLVAFVVSLALACAFAPPPLPRWHRREIRELREYGGPASVAALAWAGFRNGDYAVISFQLGAAQAGLYWRAYQLAVEYQRKISIVMMQMSFPVLARTEGRDELLALRRRMVLVLTVVLFPLLALLVLLAPTIVPWLFGPTWEAAVVPTQILAIGGAATLVTDALGAALQAAGRAKTLLGFGLAQLVVYIGAVAILAPFGLAVVATAATVVHAGCLVAAYRLVLPGRNREVARAMRDDLSAALVSCAGLVAVALPFELVAQAWSLPAFIHMLAVSAVGGVGYLVTLRMLCPAAWADLLRVLRRLAPGKLVRALERLPRGRRRVRALLPQPAAMASGGGPLEAGAEGGAVPARAGGPSGEPDERVAQRLGEDPRVLQGS